MSPLEISIMLHYHCTVSDWPGYNGNKHTDIIGGLLRVELLKPMEVLETADDQRPPEPAIVITARGSAYVEALKDVPLPIEKWVMP